MNLLNSTRLRLAAGIAAASAVLLPAAALAAPANPGTHAGHGAAAGTRGDWSQTSYNAAQSRANGSEKTLTIASVRHVRYLRSVTARLNPPGNGCHRTSPITAPVLTGGDLYAVANGWVTKYDAASGHMLWRVNPDPDFSVTYLSLAVAGGLVIVGDDDCLSVSDPPGGIVAFHASNGSPAWSQRMPNGGALTQMVVSGGYVIAAGGSPGSGTDVAVRRISTGAAVWDHSFTCAVNGTLLVVDQRVIYSACGPDGTAPRMVADAVATGAKSWTRSGAWQPLRGDAAASSGRHLYALSPSGRVVDLSPSSGKTRFGLAGAASVLAVDSTRAYASCGSFSVCAFRTATGKLIWSSEESGSFTSAARGRRCAVPGQRPGTERSDRLAGQYPLASAGQRDCPCGRRRADRRRHRPARSRPLRAPRLVITGDIRRTARTESWHWRRWLPARSSAPEPAECHAGGSVGTAARIQRSA